jgi:hypothetical protein
MDRRAAIIDIGAGVTAAAAARDWDALGAAVRALSLGLPALAARGAWTDAERIALRELRAAHEKAYQACSQATDSLGQRLGEMQANKAGWIAYALDSEAGPDGTDA